jgi:hypothetical protein
MCKKTLIIITIILLVIVSMVPIFQYYNLLYTNQVPYKNLRIRSSSGCYIYFNIKYKKKIYIIVYPSESAYYMIKKEKWFPYPFCFFVYDIGRKIKNNDYIRIRNTFKESFSDYVVDPDLLRTSSEKNNIDTTIIRNDGYLNFNLDWENQKVIIYRLLKNGINCCYNSEAGQNTIFVSPYPKHLK